MPAVRDVDDDCNAPPTCGLHVAGCIFDAARGSCSIERGLFVAIAAGELEDPGTTNQVRGARARQAQRWRARIGTGVQSGEGT